MDTWVWIVIAAVIALIVIGALVAGARKKKDWDRQHADAIRTDVAHRSTGLQEKDARAREAEAEAERKRAEADRLEQVARERRQTVESERSEVHDQLRQADEVDPDTKTTDSGTDSGSDSSFRPGR